MMGATNSSTLSQFFKYNIMNRHIGRFSVNFTYIFKIMINCKFYYSTKTIGFVFFK